MKTIWLAFLFLTVLSASAGGAAGLSQNFDLGGYNITANTTASYPVGEMSVNNIDGGKVFVRNMGPDVMLGNKMLGPAVRIAVFKYDDETAFDFLDQVTRELGWGSYGWKEFSMKMDRVGNKMGFVGSSTIAGKQSLEVGAASMPLDKRSRDFGLIVVYGDPALFDQLLDMKIE